MAVFRVRAGTLEGKVMYKEVEASTREDLARKLEKEGLYPIEVRSKGRLSLLPFLKAGGSIKPGELLVFNQGLSTLLNAGLPVIDSLDALKNSSRNTVLSDVLKDVLRQVRTGKTLSEAMREHPRVFPPLFTASIAAGERTGDLIPSIRGYIEFQKRMEAIRKKVVSAATYPVVLAFASMAVVIFLIAYVVPSFARIYVGTGAELPVATRALLGFTDFIKGHLVVFMAAILAVAFGARRALKTEKGRRGLDAVKLRVPQIGEIYRGYAVAKFSRTLAMILKSGLTLVQGLQMSGGVLGNVVLEEKLGRVIKKTVEGGSITEAMYSEEFMDEISLRMFSAGERSASLPAILEEIADYHDQDVDHRVGILTDLIEPALMIIMGIVIGTIVILMYLPIFQLGARV
ncbi:MAG: type II secretion system F family protein [Deltaproteobacteria bacterium]|nr:type II secretion system F family protein [Deltaproteobacteria bacterium]